MIDLKLIFLIGMHLVSSLKEPQFLREIADIFILYQAGYTSKKTSFLYRRNIKLVPALN